MLTIEQKNKRSGLFTGSEVHKLMGVKGLGQTGESYAFKKACEVVFGIDEEDNLETWDMKRGNELEPLAFDLFSSHMSEVFIPVLKGKFHSIDENSGATPDGLVGTDGILEIKCPRSEKFFRIIANEEIDKEYIYQMQMEMWVTERKQAYFFNYIIFNYVPMWHLIIVERDEEIINKIKERIAEAIILRDNFVKELKSRKQF